MDKVLAVSVKAAAFFGVTEFPNTVETRRAREQDTGEEDQSDRASLWRAHRGG